METLGIRSIAEWDVLAFLHRHGTSLASAELISGLLGYPRAIVGSALDSLTSAGLVERSRRDLGVRVYRLALREVSDALRHSLRELMTIAKDRQGRLLLVRYFQAEQPGSRRRGHGGLHLA
jgi:DNA-binding MarR family transcriptional regulator